MNDQRSGDEASLESLVEMSVILCSHNGAAMIGEQIAALVAQETDFAWEAVIVDNGSTDQTAAVVEAAISEDRRFRLVSADDHLGLSYARNVGVSAARGMWVAFCDDDDLVAQGWLQALRVALRDHRFVASRMEYDRLNDPASMRGRSRFQSERLETMFEYTVVNGAAFAIERDLWMEVGGNDESLRTTGEDFDFAIRVQQKTGVEPALALDSICHYRQRSGVSAAFRQARRYGEAHVMLFERYGAGRVDRRAEHRRAGRDWWWILSRAPFAAVASRQANWGRRAGVRVGRLIGSARQRTWYP